MNMIEIAKEEMEKVLSVLDEVIKEDIEPLLEMGNPETVIGKKYEEWGPSDLQQLGMIYGDKLNDFIAKKQIKKMRALESEVV